MGENFEDVMQSFLDFYTDLVNAPLFVGLGGFALALLVVLAVLSQDKPTKDETTSLPEKPWVRGLKLVGWILIPLFILLFVATLTQVYSLWQNPPPSEDALAVRVHYVAIVGFLGVLGGILGAVAAYIRIFTGERQTVATEEGLVTDRINKAVENLGATRVVKRQRKRESGKPAYEHKEDGTLNYDKPLFEEITEPNLEVRVGAIYALERIARQNLSYHIQSIEILSAYVRANFPASSAKQSPHEVAERLSVGGPGETGLEDNEILAHPSYKDVNQSNLHTDQLTPTTLEDWAVSLPQPREDLSAAIKALARRSKEGVADEKKSGFQLDLSNCNLQSVRMEGRFPNTRFDGSRLDNSTLTGDFSRSSFISVSFQGCSAYSVHAEDSDFSAANLSSAVFLRAQLPKARLWFCKINYTNFNEANLRSVDLFCAQVTHAYAHGTDFSYSRFFRTEMVGLEGIEEGPSADLWIDDLVTMSPSQEQRFPRIDSPSPGEWESRKAWAAWLRTKTAPSSP